MTTSPKKSNYENKRKFVLPILILIVLVLSSTNTNALDMLGSPASEIRTEQFNIGLEYSLSSTDFSLVNGTWTEEITGQPDGSGDAIDVVLSDFETDKVNLYFGYGIERNWELFVRLGTSSAEFGDSLFKQSESFESDGTPSLGAGMRMTLVDDRDFKIGAVAQIGWTKYNGRLDAPQWDSPGFATMDLKEFQATIGAQYRWIDGIYIYGGPFYNYVMGEYDFEYVSFDNGISEFVTTKYSWDVETSSSFGGYIGTKVDLGGESYLNLEYQMSSDSSVIGANVVFKY